jgi:hypothetical protein
MGTAISKRALPPLAALALAAAGCGGSAATRSSSASGYGWLVPAAAPAGWHTVTIPSGAALSYPPAWRQLPGDRGTATVVLRDSNDDYLGYLNLTPRQGDETLGNWSSFRVEHNAEEGDLQVKKLDSASGLRFRSGTGTCVRDSYTTTVKNEFIELACLVQGSRGSSVIVAAAPPREWSVIAPVLERAVSAFTT